MRAAPENTLAAGFALPACLLLSGLMALAGLHALRMAATESRLQIAVNDRYAAFALAENGLRSGLAWAAASTGQLPELNETLTLAASQPADNRSNLQLAIVRVGTDDQCPEFSAGSREHFEVLATARSGVAERNHVQGFSVCRESCAEAGCVAAESPLSLNYWSSDAPI